VVALFCILMMVAMMWMMMGGMSALHRACLATTASGRQYSEVVVCFGLTFDALAGLGRDVPSAVRDRPH